ncbi:MAG TPA: methyltransferase domain-containing protein [Ktedonobacterales bacterium]|jgi:arsenite methyltransferase|nr:methyltransferase domain-containing protein [Ktedonobacterales bacterium]
MLDYLAFKADLSTSESVAVYDELPLWSAHFGALLLREVPLRPATVALDVGCGTGFPLLELAERLGPASRVYSIDPWEAALERGRTKARAWGVANVEIVHGDAAAMPFADAQFDLVVANLGVNNFADRAAVFMECGRVCRPGGTIALTTNPPGHMRELYEVYAATLRELGKDARLPALERHVAHRATIAEIAGYLERAGFHVARVCEEEAVMRFADGSALLRHHFIKLGFLDEWKAVVDEDEREAVFARLEVNLNQLASERGDLTLTIPMAYVEGERTER